MTGILLATAIIALVVALNVWVMRRNKDGGWHVYRSDQSRRWKDGAWQYREMTPEEEEDRLRSEAW